MSGAAHHPWTGYHRRSYPYDQYSRLPYAATPYPGFRTTGLSFHKQGLDRTLFDTTSVPTSGFVTGPGTDKKPGLRYAYWTYSPIPDSYKMSKVLKSRPVECKPKREPAVELSNCMNSKYQPQDVKPGVIVDHHMTDVSMDTTGVVGTFSVDSLMTGGSRGSSPQHLTYTGARVQGGTMYSYHCAGQYHQGIMHQDDLLVPHHLHVQFSGGRHPAAAGAAAWYTTAEVSESTPGGGSSGFRDLFDAVPNPSCQLGFRSAAVSASPPATSAAYRTAASYYQQDCSKY
ncbi:hypothetical protein L9F63_026041 [Diploptera punctata]|uniref:Uncharacterized protein n=1 Tax=Diploptera punctata TaxID=6984 RepID=A0AAD7Z6D1_DIPPU|nr:hypothetical protein L9F63_026041 [Diploptera punctata]